MAAPKLCLTIAQFGPGGQTGLMPMLSIKDHPFYARMRQIPPQEVATWVLGDEAVDAATKEKRGAAFRRIAKQITAGRAERSKHGFNSDTNGEIARAMEWAFQAGKQATRV